MIVTDPGWFYSTLAQAAAVVVGLIGAVLGSRIIDHISRLRAERQVLDQAIGAVPRQIESRINSLKSFENYLIKQIEADNVAESSGAAQRIRSSWRDWTGSGSGSPGLINVSEDRSAAEQNLAFVRKMTAAYPTDIFRRGGTARIISNSATLEYATRLKTLAEGLPDPPRSMVIGDVGTLEEITERVTKFRHRLLPTSFLVVFIILGWIIVTGILWPLTKLPPKELTRAAIPFLICFGAGLLGLLAYFAYQFRELKQVGRVRW